MRPLLALFLLALAVPSSSAERALPPLVGPAARESLQKIRDAVPKRASVHMRVDRFGSSLDVRENFLRISLSGHKSGSGYSFSGSAGPQYLHARVNPRGEPKRGFDLWGSGADLSITPAGSGWRLWGRADSTNISLHVDRFGSGWSVWGQSGLQVNVHGGGSGLTVMGSFDEQRFGVKALAVLGAALAVLDDQPK